MRFKTLLLGATTLGILLPFAPAMAADENDASEIIVTARKRQESILAVPVTTTVLSQTLIERAQIKDLVDVAKKTTGLLLGSATVDIGTQISLRGVGSTSFDPGVDQSVSLNLDGLQVTQGSAYSVGVFDMQQIEILKGSQALFYGKSSPGGVVAIRTNDPGKDFELIGKTGYEFEAREWRNELVLSGPVTDTLGVRLAGMYDHLGGYFKNTATPNAATGAVALDKRFGNTKTLYLRGTVVFKPTPDFSMRLKLNYTRDRNDDAVPYRLTACPEGTFNYLPGLGIPLPTPYSANENCKADRKLNVIGVTRTAFPGLEPGDDGRPVTNITPKFGTLEFNYNIQPDLTLTSVTGYFRLKTYATLNCGFAGTAGSACFAEKHLTRREVTQEVRLSSDFRGPLNFSLGGFYQNGKITGDQHVIGNILYGLPARLQDGTQDVRIKSTSLFGQLRYKIVPEVEIAAGARWTSEKRSSRPTSVDLFGALGVPGATLVSQVAQPKLNTKNWSPELTVTYRPTDDLTLFGSLKQAYKSGSYNIAVPVAPGENKAFGDEKVQGAEIGLKSRFADRQVSFNLSGYYNKFKGLQVGVILPFANGLPVFSTLNAASAKIYGIDADLSYRPESVPGLDIFVAVNWNHARFTNFQNAPCAGGQTFAEGCNSVPTLVGTNFPNIAFTNPAILGGAPFRYGGQDLSGTRLGRSPDLSATFGAHQDLPVGHDMIVGFGADAQLSSKYLTNTGSDASLFQKGFAKFNLNLSLKAADNRWEVSFIGNNIGNKLTKNLCVITNYAGMVVFPGELYGGPARGPAGKDETLCALDRGRELWARVTLRF